jgi:Zn-dependent protease
MTVHEAMHAFVSHWLGDDTAEREGRLTLNPLKHIDPFSTVLLPVLLAVAGLPIFGAAKPVPFNPARLKYDEFGAALVGVAGPLTNLVLAVLGSLLIRFLGAGSGLAIDVLVVFVLVNIGFFVFNMIPFPPLDGSRLLYALAPEPLQDFMRQIESFGMAGILLFMFVLFPVIQPLIQHLNVSILNFLLG